MTVTIIIIIIIINSIQSLMSSHRRFLVYLVSLLERYTTLRYSVLAADGLDRETQTQPATT